VDDADSDDLSDGDTDPLPRDRRSSKSESKRHSQDRLASTIYRRITQYSRSCSAYVRDISFRKDRNAHEARRIAQVVDAAVREGASLKQDFMEMLLRNLAAICKADELGEPQIIHEFEFEPPQELIPREALRVALKDSQRYALLRRNGTRTPRPQARSSRSSANGNSAPPSAGSAGPAAPPATRRGGRR
jgi:hypothetical protein